MRRAGSVADAGTRSRRPTRGAQRRCRADAAWGYNTAQAFCRRRRRRARRADRRGEGRRRRRRSRRGRRRSRREDAAQLQRAARLVLPDARVARRGAAARETVRRAEKVFREDLARNPNNGRSLYGLWQAQLAKKDRAASATEKLFHDAWKRADVSLRLQDY